MVSPLACDCFSNDLRQAEEVIRRYSSLDGRRSVTRVTLAGTRDEQECRSSGQRRTLRGIPVRYYSLG
jgi:hypothetical protein